jgi:hypothetical protein
VLNSFLADVHSGKITADTIQPDYYQNLAAKLTGAVAEGLGGASFGGTDFKNTLKAFLDHNIYAFSGAKSLVMLQEYNKLLLDENGELKSFSQFKNDVLKVDELYNKTYLKAEYDNVIVSSQAAEMWPGLAAFDALEYRTTGAENVCPICGGLDGVIISTKDKRLNIIYIPNHYGCHCTFVPAASGATLTPDDHLSDLIRAAQIPKGFQKNVGKDRAVFRNDHPYIKKIGAGRIRDFDAIKDYGMKTPERIYAAGNLPELDYLNNRLAAEKWLADQGQPFDFTAADGLTITFNSAFKDTVMATSENHYQIVNKIPEVLKKPDEIWSRLVDGKLNLTYIKYYDIAPVVIQVTDSGEILEATKASHGGAQLLNKLRKGQLKFKQ